MAYTAPTPEQFKLLYPAFATTPDEAVQAALDYAAVRVGDGWSDEDGPLGISYLAAHNLTLDGHGAGAKVAGQRMAGVRSMSSGTFAASFEANSDDSVLRTTSWGKRYLELLARYAGGPLVARVSFGQVSHLAMDHPYLLGRRW